MPKPMVIDLSHWDPSDDYDAVRESGIVGVIYKATEGGSYTDDTYKSQREDALDAGLLWGAYHFANGTDVDDQVNNFIQFANVKPDELFCLDWEDVEGNTMSRAQAKEWIEKVEDRLGRPGQCVIYSGNVAKEKLGDDQDEFFGSRRLWLAHYTTGTPVCQESWETYWLWQYSETGEVPGVDSKVDLNQFDGSPAELKAQWATGEAEPSPEPDLKTVTVTITAPRGIIVNVTINEEDLN